MKYALLLKFSLILAIFSCLATFGQNSYKLPENTVFYMEMNGKALNNKINWAKLNPVFKEVLKKENKNNVWNDYSKTGIKYDDSQFHYFTFSDSIKSYNAHFILEDEKRFSSFVNTAKKEGLEVIKKPKYSYVSLDENTFLAWNQNHAVLKILNYTKPLKYDDADMQTDSTAVVDSVAVVPAMPHIENDATENPENTAEIPFNYKEEIQYLKEDLISYKNAIKDSEAEISRIKKDIQYLQKHHQYPKEKAESPAESQKESDATRSDSAEDESNGESDESYKKKMDSVKINNFKITSDLAEKSFEAFFSSNFTVEVPQDELKFKDAKADLFAFTNFGKIFKNQTNLGPLGAMGSVQKYLGKLYDSDSAYNLYFDADKVKLVTNYKHKDPKIQKNISGFYDGKPNKKLAKLLSDKTIGYLSMNLNGYKSFDAMYDLIDSMTENQDYQKEISLLVETIKIALDEKEISKIMPGNIIFILNDLSYKKVDYTDYDYDDNYNEKEVTKTKDVAVPNFTLAFGTENEGYWNRFFNMLSSNKNSAGKFVKKADYYEFKEKENTQFDGLIFKIADGIVYITTSLDNIGEKSQSATTRRWAKEVSKHSMAGWLNTPKLVEGFGKEFNDKKDGDLYNLMRKNLGEISYKTDVKSESIQSEMNYNINNSSENSLMYFFDLFDEIYKIMEPEQKPKSL